MVFFIHFSFQHTRENQKIFPLFLHNLHRKSLFRDYTRFFKIVFNKTHKPWLKSVGLSPAVAIVNVIQHFGLTISVIPLTTDDSQEFSISTLVVPIFPGCFCRSSKQFSTAAAPPTTATMASFCSDYMVKKSRRFQDPQDKNLTELENFPTKLDFQTVGFPDSLFLNNHRAFLDDAACRTQSLHENLNHACFF